MENNRMDPNISNDSQQSRYYALTADGEEVDGASTQLHGLQSSAAAFAEGETQEQGFAVEIQQSVPLEAMSADQIRQLCAAEGVTGRRDGKKRRQKWELVSLLKAHRVSKNNLAAADAVIQSQTTVPGASTSAVAAPPSSSSSVRVRAEEQDSKASIHLRLLNSLFRDKHRDDFCRSGDRPTKVAFDERQTGSASPFWVSVAADVSKTDDDAELDTFVPRTDGGVHPFFVPLEIRLGPLRKSPYTANDVYSAWGAIKRSFKQRHANFNQSGNHSQEENDFARFCNRLDVGVFYLFQWLLVFPEMEDFVLSKVPTDGTPAARTSVLSRAKPPRSSQIDVAQALLEDTAVNRELGHQRHLDEMAKLDMQRPRAECEYLNELLNLQQKCMNDILATAALVPQVAGRGAAEQAVNDQMQSYTDLLENLRKRVSAVMDGTWIPTRHPSVPATVRVAGASTTASIGSSSPSAAPYPRASSSSELDAHSSSETLSLYGDTAPSG
eukprot:GHVU01011573.1.p1 GENE.GHVU01011573.1~~GHVU01011573.1.p1  ORF type:complete len:497 (-),score=59.19 GHVU01011573.1:1771-3261(-)